MSDIDKLVAAILTHAATVRGPTWILGDVLKTYEDTLNALTSSASKEDFPGGISPKAIDALINREEHRGI